jgi:hypothetical protein
MKKNGFSVMLSVSKSTGHLLDGLYFTVQTLGNGIGYTMCLNRQMMTQQN